MSNCFPRAFPAGCRSPIGNGFAETPKSCSKTDPFPGVSRHFQTRCEEVQLRLIFIGQSYALSAYDTCIFGTCAGEYSNLNAQNRIDIPLLQNMFTQI